MKLFKSSAAPCSGAYNNAGLVSVGGVITANVPPPPYSATLNPAGRRCWWVLVCVCLGWVWVKKAFLPCAGVYLYL